MEENRKKSVERPQNKNLKRDAGPGRPQGQLNYATIYRNALIRLGKENNKTPDDIEEEMIANGALLARKGDYRFYKDVLDRIHGQAVQKTEVKSNITLNFDNSFIEDETTSEAKTNS